jgi:Immunity protein 52
MRQEITTTKFNGYFITAYWGPSAETPAGLAKRLFRMINSFRRIDPILSQWLYGGSMELETLRDDFAENIARNIQRDDFGKVIPDGGYWFHAGAEGQSRNRHFSVSCHVGMNLSGFTRNTVILNGSALVESAPETHSYPIIHSALLAIGDSWAPDTVEANCSWLVYRTKAEFSFRPAWMRYLRPELARQVMPPASALVERLPNGGLLLLATDETFDVDNPQHVAAAEDIAAALAKLDRSRKSSQT